MKRTSFPLLAILPVLAAWGCSDAPEPVTRARTESVYGIDEVVPARRVTEVPAAAVEPSPPAPGPPAPDAAGTDVANADPLGEGVRLFEQRRYLESATRLAVAVQDEPREWYAHYLLGLALWKSGELDDAADSLARSAEIKGDFVKTHVNLSRVLNDAGRPGEALEAARAAAALTPDDPTVLYLVGRSLANLGRHEEALDALRASLERGPDNGDVHNRIGLVRIRQGRFGEAVAPLERAVALLPDRDYVRNNLGIAYEGVGRMRDAESQYAAGLEIAGDSDKLSVNLARVQALPDAPDVFVARAPEPSSPVESGSPTLQMARSSEESGDDE